MSNSDSFVEGPFPETYCDARTVNIAMLFCVWTVDFTVPIPLSQVRACGVDDGVFAETLHLNAFT